MILWSRHLYHEAYKLSKNFTEGNTRKVSACFLRLHVCDVIQFRDDYARMRINGPLASLTRLRGRRIALISYVLSYCEHSTCFWRWKFRIRRSYPMDRMSSILHMIRLLCFVIFYFRNVISCPVRTCQMTWLVGESNFAKFSALEQIKTLKNSALYL